MNTYIKMQISNMLMFLDSFQKSCEIAATKDDGKIDKEEKKDLAKIKAASDRFKKELEKYR